VLNAAGVRWLALCCALVAALVLTAGTGASSTPQPLLAKCPKGSVPALIGGKRTCLRAGRRCAKRLDRQYHRYRFHCHSGRLTRGPKAVPLTPLTIDLQPLGGSGVTGTVTLTPMGASRTKVVIEIPNPPLPSMLAHIHIDKCPDAGDIFYPLSNVVGGRSESEVGAIAPLRRAAFSINVHGAAPDYPAVACGDIPRV
jgi:hypothetical protein